MGARAEGRLLPCYRQSVLASTVAVASVDWGPVCRADTALHLLGPPRISGRYPSGRFCLPDARCSGGGAAHAPLTGPLRGTGRFLRRATIQSRVGDPVGTLLPGTAGYK